MPTDHPLVWLTWPATRRSRPMVVVPPPLHPQDGRDLADHDLDGDPGQDPGDHRGRQELRDPPQPEAPTAISAAPTSNAVNAMAMP